MKAFYDYHHLRHKNEEKMGCEHQPLESYTIPTLSWGGFSGSCRKGTMEMPNLHTNRL